MCCYHGWAWIHSFNIYKQKLHCPVLKNNLLVCTLDIAILQAEDKTRSCRYHARMRKSNGIVRDGTGDCFSNNCCVFLWNGAALPSLPMQSYRNQVMKWKNINIVHGLTRWTNPDEANQTEMKMETIWTKRMRLLDFRMCIICRTSGNCSKYSNRKNRSPEREQIRLICHIFLRNLLF